MMCRKSFLQCLAVSVFALALILPSRGLAETPDCRSYAKRLTVCPSETILAALDGNQYANVPVMLRLSAAIAGFSPDDFQDADGGDILVLDETGAVCPCEIEVWNPEGESIVWTKAATLSSDTRFYLFYGGPVNADNTPSAVWDTYAGVWHLDEQGEGGTVADSTVNSFAGTCWSGSNGKADGVIGGYRMNREVDQTGKGGIVFAGTKSLNLGSHFTLSAYVRHNTATAGWDHLFYRKNESANWNSWSSELYAQDGAYGKLSVLGAASNGYGCYLRHGIAEADTWYHITLVYDGKSARLYNNGVLTDSGSLAYAPNWNGDYAISLGIDSDSTGTTWQGGFDEFRLCAGSFDDVRAAVEYGLMQPGATVCAVTDNTEAMPVLSDVALVRDADGTFSVRATLAEGSATSVKAVFDDQEQELAPDGAASGWTVAAPLTGLAPATAYSCKIVAVGGDGSRVVRHLSEILYTGTVSVSKVSDAREENLVPGAFMFSRADTDDATRHALVVSYTVDGTAVAGDDYEPLAGTVVIPAGAASVTVPLNPLVNFLTDDDVAVAVTVAPGLYAPSPDPATVTILNSRNGLVARYTKRMRVTVTEGAYPHEETLFDFPALIRLKEGANGFSYGDFRTADFSDLAFTDAKGNLLPYEVQDWDAQGESLVWVKVPRLDADTVLYVLYGTTVPVANTSAAEVWSRYIGVWHMDDTGVGAVPILDATANALHGVAVDPAAEGADPAGNIPVADGVFGGGRKISTGGGNAVKGRILVPNTDGRLNAYPDVSVSLWIRPTGSESWAYLIDRKAKDSWDTWGL